MARCGHAPMLTAVPVGRFGVQNPEIPVQVDLDTGAVGPGDQHAVGGGAFARADTARGGRGSGLGLAIVAALTTTHGGHANATNHPDGGAELRITLPTPRPPFHEELPRITSSDTKDPNREHDTSDQ